MNELRCENKKLFHFPIFILYSIVAKIIIILIVMLTAKVIYSNLVFVLLLVLCWDR